MSPDAFLGRALLDPTTGLPNVPYFKLIREWEQRRAERRKSSVREVRMRVAGGAVRVRRALSWRLCRELRESDLIASGGPGEFHILLTSPDAEHADRICDRIERMAGEINRLQPDEPPLEVSLEVEPPLEPQAAAEAPAPVVDPPAAAAAQPALRAPEAKAVAPGPVTGDREVGRPASVEPGSVRSERRRAAPDPEGPIVPPRGCEPPEPPAAA